MQPRRNQKPSTWTSTTATTTVKGTTRLSGCNCLSDTEMADVEPLELILFTASSTNVVLMVAGEGQSQRV